MEMIDAGMNVARLNFSHGDHKMHGRTVARIREAMSQRPGAHVAIMLDTKGPEIRTGYLKDGKAIELVRGQELFISTDYELKGDKNTISCSYKKLSQTVSPGSPILAADGAVVMRVEECKEEYVEYMARMHLLIVQQKRLSRIESQRSTGNSPEQCHSRGTEKHDIARMLC